MGDPDLLERLDRYTRRPDPTAEPPAGLDSVRFVGRPRGRGTDDGLPLRVRRRLEPGETPLVVIAGAQASGLLVTDRRAFRWRPPGAVASVDLGAVTAVELRRAAPDHTAHLAIHVEGAASIAIAMDDRHVRDAMDAVPEIVGAATGRRRACFLPPVEMRRRHVDDRTIWALETADARRRAAALAAPTTIDRW